MARLITPKQAEAIRSEARNLDAVIVIVFDEGAYQFATAGVDQARKAAADDIAGQLEQLMDKSHVTVQSVLLSRNY